MARRRCGRRHGQQKGVRPAGKRRPSGVPGGWGWATGHDRPPARLLSACERAPACVGPLPALRAAVVGLRVLRHRGGFGFAPTHTPPLSSYPCRSLWPQTAKNKNNVERLAVERLDLLIVDKAHHSLADSYRKIMQRLGCLVDGTATSAGGGDERGGGISTSARSQRRLAVGFTATPMRGDKQQLSDMWVTTFQAENSALQGAGGVHCSAQTLASIHALLPTPPTQPVLSPLLVRR